VTVALHAPPSPLLELLRDHDRATYEHCLAVGSYAARLAHALGIHPTDGARIRAVGELHDVGKIRIPRALLQSPEPLTRHDAAIIRDHVTAGTELVAADRTCAHCAAGVRAHHERLDGHGYPDGLAGDAIPLEARLVTIADTFDALTRGRPYRPPERIGTVLAILYAARDRQMEGRFVDAFIAMIERDGIDPGVAVRR